MSIPIGLAYFRHCAQVSQARMAEKMGMPIRTYEDIEAGRSVFRPIHIAAAKMALIEIAVEKEDLTILPLPLLDTIKKAGELLGEANKKPAS